MDLDPAGDKYHCSFSEKKKYVRFGFGSGYEAGRNVQEEITQVETVWQEGSVRPWLIEEEVSFHGTKTKDSKELKIEKTIAP